MQHKRRTGTRKAKPIPEHVTEPEYLKLLEHTPGIHHKIAMMFAFESGLRISECIKLKREDINLGNGTFKVVEGKGKKDRVVSLPYSFEPDYHMRFIPVACSKRAMETAFTKAAETSGLKAKKPKVCFHSLRPGYAVFCLDHGMTLQQIQILMGHEDIQTTQHYARMNPVDALNAWRTKVAQDEWHGTEPNTEDSDKTY